MQVFVFAAFLLPLDFSLLNANPIPQSHSS